MLSVIFGDICLLLKIMLLNSIHIVAFRHIAFIFFLIVGIKFYLFMLRLNEMNILKKISIERHLYISVYLLNP